MCAIRQEEDSGGRVVKLAPVVALDDFDLSAERIRHIKKLDKVVNVSDLRFRGKVRK
jgi:hypothetical protein